MTPEIFSRAHKLFDELRCLIPIQKLLNEHPIEAIITDTYHPVNNIEMKWAIKDCINRRIDEIYKEIKEL